MKILFCAYRDWALRVYEHIKNHHKINEIYVAKNTEELEYRCSIIKYDIIIVVGWSWKIKSVIVDSNFVVGIHPSDLPKYSGGSPIQNQILDGVKESCVSLFKLNQNYDEGEIINKIKFMLYGNINCIIDNIEKISIYLIDKLISCYPNIVLYNQKKENFLYKKRIKKEQNHINFEKNTCKEIYDNIRMLGDPYPNAFIEDDTGILFFLLVEFLEK